jgi:hypothetical protein
MERKKVFGQRIKRLLIFLIQKNKTEHYIAHTKNSHCIHIFPLFFLTNRSVKEFLAFAAKTVMRRITPGVQAVDYEGTFFLFSTKVCSLRENVPKF